MYGLFDQLTYEFIVQKRSPSRLTTINVTQSGTYLNRMVHYYFFFVRHSTCAVCAQLAVGKQLKNALNIAWRNPSFESTLWTKAHATAEFG